MASVTIYEKCNNTLFLKVLTDQSTAVRIEADLDSNGTIGMEDALRLMDQLSS